MLGDDGILEVQEDYGEVALTYEGLEKQTVLPNGPQTIKLWEEPDGTDVYRYFEIDEKSANNEILGIKTMLVDGNGEQFQDGCRLDPVHGN